MLNYNCYSVRQEVTKNPDRINSHFLIEHREGSCYYIQHIDKPLGTFDLDPSLDLRDLFSGVGDDLYRILITIGRLVYRSYPGFDQVFGDVKVDGFVLEGSWGHMMAGISSRGFKVDEFLNHLEAMTPEDFEATMYSPF